MRSLASTTSPLIDSHSPSAGHRCAFRAGWRRGPAAGFWIHTHPLGVYLHIDAFHASFIIVMFACRRP